MTTLGTTNGEILGFDGINYDPDRIRIVRDIVRARFNLLLNDEPVADNIKVFVKQEPHKMSKIKEGRLRLISAVSLIDTFIDRIIWGWMARACLDNVGWTPCMVGWSPVRGGWRPFTELYANKPVLCLDKTMWDWTMQEWLVHAFSAFVENLAIGAPDWMKEMMRLRLKLLFKDCVFEFEDQTIVPQQGIGIMKSGCFLTIILNSVCQSMLHYVANQRLGLDPALNEPRVMGDDTVQHAVPRLDEYVKHLESLGAQIKGVKIQNWVEFAGFAFDGNACWPAYWQKHLFNLSHSPNLEETLLSYQYLWVLEPVMYAFVTRVAREVGPDALLPKMIALDIMNCPR